MAAYWEVVVLVLEGKGCSPNLSHWSNGWSESYPPSMWTHSHLHQTHTMSCIHATAMFFSGHLVSFVNCFVSSTCAHNMRSCLLIRSAPIGVKHLLLKTQSEFQPLPNISTTVSRVDDEAYWDLKKKSFQSTAAFEFNWTHFRGSSCHVLGALTDCSNLQILRSWDQMLWYS